MVLCERLKPFSMDNFEITAEVFKEPKVFKDFDDRYIFVMRNLNGNVITAMTYQTTDREDAQTKFRKDVKEWFEKYPK